MKPRAKFIVFATLAVVFGLCFTLWWPTVPSLNSAQVVEKTQQEKSLPTAESVAPTPMSSPSRQPIRAGTAKVADAIGQPAIWHPYIKRIAWYDHPVTKAQQAIESFRKAGKATFAFRLFDGAVRSLELKHEGSLPKGAKGFSVYGHFTNFPGSIGVLSEYDGCSAGVAMIPNEGYFRFRVGPDGKGVVEEVGKVGVCGMCDLGANNSALNQGGDFHVRVPPGGVDETLARTSLGASVKIDLCIGITSEAKTTVGRGVQMDSVRGGSSSSSPGNTINAVTTAAVQFVNAVHEQSGSSVEFRIVRWVEGLYQPSGGAASVDWENNLRSIDPTRSSLNKANYDAGHFAALDEARDESGADLTVLVRADDGSGISGISWIPINSSDPVDRLGLTNSHAIVEVEDLEVVLTHELGHTLGCDHDRKNGVVSASFKAGQSYLAANPYGSAMVLPDSIFGLTHRYATVMCHVGYGEYYMPYFSTPLVNLNSSGVSLGLEDSINECNNVRAIQVAAPYVRNYGDGEIVHVSQVFKQNHWARHEIQNCIDLRIFMNTADSAWASAEKPATRGEMVTILSRALTIAGINLSPPPASYKPFPNDTESQNSSHWENIKLFASKGWTKGSTGNVFDKDAYFYPNRTATLGEMVLFATRAFNLASNTSATDAVGIYNSWRSRFRSATFRRPQRPETSMLTAYDLNPLTPKAGARWRNETSILSLEFNTGEGGLQDSGYSVPARRAVFAKFMVNLLYYQSSPSNARSL